MDGWRFSITSDPEPAGDYTMTPPAPVIVVAPRAGMAGQPAANAEHGEAIAEILSAMWPGSGRQEDYLRRAIDLPHHLQHDLNVDPGEPIANLLRRHSPHVRGQVRRVLWLDWGTRGTDVDQPPLKVVELRAWLRFASQFLAAHCPADLRVVAYLAIETPGVTKLLRSSKMHAGSPGPSSSNSGSKKCAQAEYQKTICSNI
ncbi:MAG: hypothetical protein MJE77_26005 [Proteobacteria bacterium]|nr:hypothetical protein [Pseudomonadota bacterium]